MGIRTFATKQSFGKGTYKRIAYPSECIDAGYPWVVFTNRYDEHEMVHWCHHQFGAKHWYKFKQPAYSTFFFTYEESITLFLLHWAK